MKCCHPRFIRVPDFKGASSLGTYANVYMAVPCGKCIFCLQELQKEWICKIVCEMYVVDASYFVTLTFNDENLGENKVKKIDIQRFMHALRTYIHRNFMDDLLITYYACGEYGKTTNRAHYHLLLFGLPYLPLNSFLPVLEHIWHKGFVYVKRADIHNVHYITKYMTKIDPRDHGDAPSFYLSSRRPSLGKRYWTDDKIKSLNSSSALVVHLPNGYNFKLPRLWKKKFLSDETKLKCRDFYDSHFVSDYKRFYHDLTSRQEFSKRKLDSLKNRFKK